MDIDTRSDVYSLGVLLYELLTGSTPITADELKQAGLLQIQRRIVDNEPPKPSTRLSTSGEKLTIIAKHRSVSPERLHRELRGDLDWIVMKALEKDRSRRYESASRFAEDVQRFLADDFVEARPPSSWYRMTKFCKRHTALVASTTVVIVALSCSLAIAVWSYRKQTQIANDLRISKETAENQRDEKDQAYAKLRDELIDKALLFAHNGEEAKTEMAIEQARIAGAREAWQEMIRAQLKLYGTNPRDAFQHLNRAIEFEPENRTAHAMLGVALIFDGGGEEFNRELELLNSKYQPQTSFDKLFAAQVYAMLVNSNETDRSTRLVREALSERMTPLGVAIEAQVLGHEALDRGSREKAKVALDKITAAHEFLPNNPFVSMIYVSVHHTAYNLDVPGIDLNRFLQVLRDNQEMRQYGLGHVVVGMCYEDLEMHNDAMEAYSHGAANSSWWYYECRNMLAAGRVEDALQLATNEPITNDSWVHSKRIEAQRVKATQGNLDVSTLLKLWADPIVRDKSSTLVAEVLLLNGEKKRAIEIATSHNLHETFSSLSVEVMRGDISIDELVKKYQSSRITLGLSLYTVGMMRWAEGDDVAAREAFIAAVDTKCFFSYGYYNSKVMLSLMKKGLLNPPKAK